jgi:pimeloyl-ACP methyl ester carboxylesterase
VFDVYESCRPVECGDVTLNVAVHGPEGGDVVLLIHGFPDSARLWRNQIPALAEAGYRVVAPDLRGFGRSDRPLEVLACVMRSMVGDMVSVLGSVGADRAHLVGHDWGAAVVWQMAAHAPQAVSSATVLSVGHPAAYQRAGLEQRQKGWYILLFQFEGVAERWLSDNDWFWLRRWSQSDEVENWIADLSRPGALTAALNVYRANMGPESWVAPLLDPEPVRVPVMGVWSSGDLALTEVQMTGSARFVADEWRYERFDGVGHWIPLEAPDRLNPLLLEWLAR